MMIRSVLLAGALVSTVGQAQTGRGTQGCDAGSGFACQMVVAREGEGREERNWIRAIVLWRTDSPATGHMRDTTQWRVSLQRTMALRRAAEDSGRMLLGGDGPTLHTHAVMTWGFGRGSRDTVFVMGRQFELPQRDSALVLMLDIPAADTTRLSPRVESAWIPAELDQSYWPKRWRSGDTLFTVLPRGPSRAVQDALMQSPSVRAYLLRSSTPEVEPRSGSGRRRAP